MSLERVICGDDRLKGGVMQSARYDSESDRYALSFSTACTPTQLYTIEGRDRETIVCHTNERVLGIPTSYLSPGEDASFTSIDGLRISARLYLPATALGFEGPRPLVYYVHGGPQGQERPDFAWFSMPLIQFLTLNGFAVFVPNVRGSTGYGLSYTKPVDRDWGGRTALTMCTPWSCWPTDCAHRHEAGRRDGPLLRRLHDPHPGLRHPELWAAAVDMFGPYDLMSASERIPVAWKPYFAIAWATPTRIAIS